MSYWVIFLLSTPDNQSLSSILREVMKEKVFFGFQKFCPAFFGVYLCSFKKYFCLTSDQNQGFISHECLEKVFFWNPSKTNSFTIEFIFVFLKINKKVGHPFKQWSILLHCAKCLKEIRCMWNLYENMYATQNQILLIRS